MPTGRIDGVVSNLSLAVDFPEVSDSIQQLRAKFMRKGLTEKDLVILSGMILFSAISNLILYVAHASRVMVKVGCTCNLTTWEDSHYPIS